MNELGRNILIDRYARDGEEKIEDVFRRVANTIGENDSEKTRFYSAMSKKRFIPAGRILAANQDRTYYNCYVLPSPQDSRSGITVTLTQMIEIMARGGGVGINISSLRPRGTDAKKVGGTSSGAVSWGGLYSYATGLVEQGGCFAPDVRISTDKGLIKAKDLYERMGNGESFRAHTHKGLRNIIARFDNGTQPVYSIETSKGYEVEITENHGVAVFRGGEITTVPLCELSDGDNILIGMGQSNNGDYIKLSPPTYVGGKMSTTLNRNFHVPNVLDEDFAYFLGYSFANGSVDPKEKSLSLSVPDSHPDIYNRLSDSIKSLFMYEPKSYDGNGAYRVLRIFSRQMIEWMKHHGILKQKAQGVRVPELIFQSPSSVMLSFVAGYFDADGCNRGRKGGYGIDSISYGVLRDIQKIYALHGIISHISTTKRDNVKWQDIHRLIVSGAQFMMKFETEIPAEKVFHTDSVRDLNNKYPASMYKSLGVPYKYRTGIYQGGEHTVSHSSLTRILRRMIVMGESSNVTAIRKTRELLNVVPDAIVSVEYSGDKQTYDFEVEDVHLLSGNGIYTSNSRRGALMLILNDWHPDLLEFIDSKREAGKITNANISVGISDAFMNAVENDLEWNFVFPDTSYKDYDEIWTGDLDDWKERNLPVIHYKSMRAKDIWNKIMVSAWSSAEPGVWFRDRANAASNSWYYTKLVCTNPCFTGDTKIYTDRGLITAKELYESQSTFEVVTDGRFGFTTPTSLPASNVFKTGTKNIKKLTTKEGYTLRATEEHKVRTERGWIEIKNLIKDDKIHILNLKGGFGAEGSLHEGRVIGWLIGDGSITKDSVVLYFYHDKREISESFALWVNEIVKPLTSNNRDYSVGVYKPKEGKYERIESVRLKRYVDDIGLTGNKFNVPDVVYQGTEDMQKGFLQALFSADGTILNNEGKASRSIRLSSISIGLLEGVQHLLSNFGIVSKIYKNRRDAGIRQLPDSNREPKDYFCQADHELVVSKAGIEMFWHEIGFILDKHSEKLQHLVNSYKRGPYRESYCATVDQILDDGVEDVYDVNVPETHALIANGIVIHNCGEIGLQPFAVCNLGHINLSKMYIDNENGRIVDWVSIVDSTKTAIRFLDNVIDVTPYHFEENERVQKGERRIGLGTMGFAELLIHMGIRYGSKESIDLAEKIQSIISISAYKESSDIALEKGSFPLFDAEKFLASGFMQVMPENLRTKIRTDGIRNAFLLTQAPTGTVGTMMNTSTGIEPFFSFKHFRKTRMGMFEESHPIVDGLEQLEDYHVTTMDITPDEHVAVACAFQKWIDNSISKTVNLPNSATVDDVATVYNNIYQNGGKGGTVYRDGSRDEQILNLASMCPDCEEESLIEEAGCSTCHACGYSVCST